MASGDNSSGFGGGQMSGGGFGAFGEGNTDGGQPNIGPFSRLLDIEGVDGVEDIFGNVGGGMGGDNPFGGSAPSENDAAPVMDGSEGGAPSGNPFANFDPLEEGNPFVEGDEPDVSFGGGGASAGGPAGDSAGGNSFGDGQNPFGDAPSEGTFLEGEVPEGLSDEELAVSSEVTDSEDAPAQDSGSFGGNPMESNSNYNWDFDFARSGSPNQDYPASDSGAPADDSKIENADSGSFSGVFPEDAGSYEYDFSEVEGEYDFSGVYPEGKGSYEYDFSSDGENPFTGGMSSDLGTEIPFAGGSDGGSNPFASSGIPSADTGISFGGMMDGFGM